MRTIILIWVIGLFLAGIYFGPKVLDSIHRYVVFNEARAAASGFPMQFGLTNTSQIICTTVAPSGNCPNHRLCAMKPNYLCANYTVIMGQQAGGDGTEIIIDTTQYTMSGYKPGDSVIAAGISDALIEIIATPNGCAGCQ